MSEQDVRAAISEQKSIDDQLRTSARFGRMEDSYITKREIEERCRACHAIDNMKHDESTTAINRLIAAIEKLDVKLDTYIPPVIHWVGEIKTGALGFLSAICIALTVYLATN